MGIGASAGGLEAFQKFFGAMPADSGMAFVLVQHLDPHHSTILPELLAKATAMNVEQVKDETPVQPDHVYVIPPNSILTIEGGILRVQTPPDAQSLRSPIDRMFASLATDQGRNAVCILLSGSGSDGTLGLRAVKEHGGMAMAQSPESAKHDAILRSAISTGLVDHVLPPEELAQKLMEYTSYLRNLNDVQGPEALITATQDELTRICTILLRKTGHDFSQYKTGTLLRRIQRRVQVLQAPTVAAYLTQLRDDPKEADQLFRDFLISVTHFFRDPEAFSVLAREVIPRILSVGATDGSLRIWTPGCATGEETYSVAILIKEAMLQSGDRAKVQIFAGDIDDEALEFARQGRYPDGIAEHVTPERLERFFVKRDHSYQVNKDVREMCIFSVHNLIKDPPFSRLDLVVCRNLLIYLEGDLQRYVASLFHYALHRGGYLFLGPSESISGPPELFRTVDRKYRVFQRGDLLGRGIEPLPTSPHAHAAAPARVAPLPARAEPPDLVAALERVLLDQYAPAWVVVNGQGEALYFSPRIGRYLEPAPGAPSTDVVSMARSGLRVDLRTAIHKAGRSGTTVVHEDVAVEADGQVQRINLLVRPLAELGAGTGLFLVVFQEQGPATSKEPSPAGEVPAQAGDHIIHQLESELRTTKEHLQAVIEEVESSNEELKSSNEELIATNEELQSTNEELQTSKEELQSVNEELETINVELTKKIEELDRVNSDLENVFQATQIPTVFVDNELRIKRFTAAATDVFRLIEGDLGRPITDIAARFGGDLLADMKDVLRTLTMKVRQVRLADGTSTYVVRVLPYRRVDNTIDGLVLTFADVTQLELAQAQRARLAALVESSHDAIVGRTFEGRITTWNDAASRMFGFTPDEAVGSPVSLFIPPEHLEDLERIEEGLKHDRRVAPFESVRQTKDGRQIPVWVAISPLKDVAGHVIGSSAIIRDVSEIKRARGVVEESRRKDQFLAVLSHELRGPLASLRLCVEMLQARDLPRDEAFGADPVAIADRQLEHLTVLVDQLLDASRIGSGSIAVQPIDVNLVEVVETSAEDHRAVLKDAGLGLELDLPSSPLWARCDPIRLSQIMVNLLGNAAKFTDPGGKVTVRLAREDHEWAALSVRDTGLGIEPERLSSLFQPFNRIEPTERVDRGRHGLGLGLALVRALVDAHGGTVAAQSEGKGRGTTFLVRLPLLDGRPHAATVASSGENAADVPAIPAPPAGPRRRLLVVEDHWDTAEALRSVLQTEGYAVEVAPTGTAALAKAREFRPEIVLCDLALPGGMDGFAVATNIRRAPATYGSPHLIALTGYGQSADKKRAMEAGFGHHIVKGERPRTLIKLLAELGPTA